MESVCESQQDFNSAFRTAQNAYNQYELKKLAKSPITTISTIVSIVYLIFIVWAVILAMRVKEKESRILHVTLALIAGPAYVFGYYLSR